MARRMDCSSVNGLGVEDVHVSPPINDLKAKWQELFSRAAPNNSRSFLEARLACKIQELSYASRATHDANLICSPTNMRGKSTASACRMMRVTRARARN